MKCTLSLEHPVRLEEADYSAKLTALAETGREDCGGHLCEGKVMQVEMTLKKGKRRDSVKSVERAGVGGPCLSFV